MNARAASLARAYGTIALVLQGGGALGSYQAGVYEGLAEADMRPDWIAGISIGALNAAIIAGNPLGHRVERLREFWETISRQPYWPMLPTFDMSGWPLPLQNNWSGLSAWRALTEGQSGFFHPRFPPSLLQQAANPASVSWYDTSPLRSTLERLVDFDRINDPRGMRVSVGAVNVRTGNFAYFDNRQGKLRVEHFMASGALPPGFPAVEIDGEFYWDGGMVSNTPLYKVLADRPCHDALIFQVDLWRASGQLPRDLPGVTERAKEIQFSSRTRLVTEYMRLTQENQGLLHDLMELVPPEKRNDPAYLRAQARESGALTNLIHLIYSDKPYEGHYKDYEFSLGTMRTHWQSGLDDMRHTLAHPQWLERPSAEKPFVTHDVHRG